MKQKLHAGLLWLTFTALLAGCKPGAAPVDGAVPQATWVEEGLEHNGATIDLGYRQGATSDNLLVPIAAISRDGQPVAGAMVFVRLVHVSPGKNETVGDEVATVFEEASAAGEKPVFVPVKLQPPASKTPTLARFRIVLPGSEQDWQHDMPLP